VRTEVCVDGTAMVVRPIEIEDTERLERMFGRLSRASVYFRFFSPIHELSPAMLQRLAGVDHSRRDALVMLHGDEIVAVARYDAEAEPEHPERHEAEIALTVEDAWQHRGIGRRLARELAALAIERGFDTFIARILPDNRAALGLVRKLAPETNVRFTGGDYEARVPLASTHPATRFSPISM
jgi:GNAT superfamily N-acetyltransferase